MKGKPNQKDENSDNSGFTAPENVPGQAESRASKARLDALLDARRARPEPEVEVADPAPLAWEAMYYDLLAEKDEDGRARWDWRKALYIAWNCVPTSKRWPRHEVQLIDLLGLTNTRTIRQWKQNDPEIEKRIQEGPKALLMGHVADVLEALVKVATDSDPKAHQDRKLFLELTGQYKPRGVVEVANDGNEPLSIALTWGDLPGESKGDATIETDTAGTASGTIKGLA